MIIIIPMAGDSSRFFDKGYDVPKFMLPYAGRTIFDECLDSFSEYYSTAKFIFIIKENYNDKIFPVEEFVQSHCRSLVIKDYTLVKLENTTRGQAETVELGLKRTGLDISDEELVIFNIDTFRYSLNIPKYKWNALFDAYEDSNADEKKYSFAKVDNDERIVMTAEKVKIGPWVSTGLYIFKSASLYSNVYNKVAKEKTYNYYIAPLFNYINNTYVLKCNVGDVVFAGTPDEYQSICKHFAAYIDKLED